MTRPEVLVGPPAFSRARLASTLRTLQHEQPEVRSVFAEFVHFLFVDGALDAQQHSIVVELLR